jgi:hypothetical protein
VKRDQPWKRNWRRRLFPAVLAAAVLLVGSAGAQQALSPPRETPADFLRASDEVLAEVSRLLALEVKEPLKKSLRTREEVRKFLIEKVKEEDEPAKRYADQKVLEKFGLLPKDFDLDAFLVELLTEQIAGYYDPKAREFYLVDWEEGESARGILAHEMVHALHDQHYGIEAWLKAARPNDDAHLARDSVLEGSALAAMFDYLLRDSGRSVRDLPDFRRLVDQGMLSDMGDSPQLAAAPPYIRDVLLFPYTAGMSFAQAVLRSTDGWAGFHERVFRAPPASTQQVLHPELYEQGYLPEPVALPDLNRLLGQSWRLLDENLVGEFGLHAVLKQHLGSERADELAPAWNGDRYAILEHRRSKMTLLVFRLRLADEDSALRFFGQYSEALETKYEQPTRRLRRPNFFSFESEDGPAFLYCQGLECLAVEGGSRGEFDRIVREMGWRAAPRPRTSRREGSIALTPASTAAAPAN